MKILKKILIWLGLGLFLLAIVGFIFVRGKMKDRHPGYLVDITYDSKEPRPIEAGFSALKITPAVEDRWIDVNDDARFVEEDGVSYEDVNNNGQFDPVWIAGFHNRRPAQGVHDDLWARRLQVSRFHQGRATPQPALGRRYPALHLSCLGSLTTNSGLDQ